MFMFHFSIFTGFPIVGVYCTDGWRRANKKRIRKKYQSNTDQMMARCMKMRYISHQIIIS